MKSRWFGTMILSVAIAAVLALCGNRTVGASEKIETVTIELPGEVEMEFKKIPAGRFMMGSPESEKGREPYEGPQHQVVISKPFCLGTYEVTHRQWKAVKGAIRDNAGFSGSNFDAPMQSTAWKECQDFIDKLNDLKLGKFRMPTEAEWEYACRAGTTTRFHWGDDPELTEIDDYAWYDENAEGQSYEAGEKKPNPWGLYDMTGNVYEWCSDWYSAYTDRTQKDPQGPKKGTHKVFRGGEWFNPPENCRSAFRGKFPPGGWLYFAGVRVVMEIEE